MTGISGQSFRRSPGDELIVGGGRRRRGEVFFGGGFAPKLNICITVSQFRLQSWGQLQKSGIELAVIVLRALFMMAVTCETVHASLKYGHVDYAVCIINFISMKNSKYQL